MTKALKNQVKHSDKNKINALLKKQLTNNEDGNHEM